MAVECNSEEITLEDKFKKLCCEVKDSKIVIYGAGKYLHVLQRYINLQELNIIAISDRKFIDSKSDNYSGYSVCDPNNLKSLDFDYLLITVENGAKISKSLTEDYGIDERKIRVLFDMASAVENVRIDACTICQLKCKSCYMRNTHNTVGINYLKYDDFVKFINRNSYVKSVELSNSGEIFFKP